MIGEVIRLERILDRNSHRTVIVPMDHGATVGPIQGLADMRTAISKLVSGGPTPFSCTKAWSARGTGAAGVSIGRNAFQHDHPGRMIRALSEMVHESAGGEAAVATLGG